MAAAPPPAAGAPHALSGHPGQPTHGRSRSASPALDPSAPAFMPPGQGPPGPGQPGEPSGAPSAAGMTHAHAHAHAHGYGGPARDAADPHRPPRHPAPAADPYGAYAPNDPGYPSHPHAMPPHPHAHVHAHPHHAPRERRHSSASTGSVGHAGESGLVGLDLSGLSAGDLGQLADFINSHKLAGNRPVYNPAHGDPGGAYGRGGYGRAGAHLPQAHVHERDPKWVQPSGPRRPGEGVENEEQGIVNAEKTAAGMILRITLLAAGFVIGPSGSSVREIMRVTGADVKSWTENRTAQQLLAGAGGGSSGPRRPCRMVVVEGDEAAVLAAVNVIVAAVDRYKDLCEGRYQGQAVPRLQRVLGVDFCYQPPPRAAAPSAAALKGGAAERGPHATHRPLGRDEYGYSPPSSGAGGGVGVGSTLAAAYGSYPPYPGPGGGGGGPGGGGGMDPAAAAGAYGSLAGGAAGHYLLAPALPASPVAMPRGGLPPGAGGGMEAWGYAPHGGPYGMPGRPYDPSSPPYGSRGGSNPSANPSNPSSKTGGGGGLNGGGGGGGYNPYGMGHMAMGPLDPSALAMGPLPLPMPPGSPPMALVPGGALQLPPGTDVNALTDYLVRSGGFMAPGGLMPLDVGGLGGGAGGAYAPMDLQTAFMAGLVAAQPGGFVTGLAGPGFYYGAPLPGVPLSPGGMPGSPTRAGRGGGGGGPLGAPPSPSRLNPLAQPWAAPFAPHPRDAPAASTAAGAGAEGAPRGEGGRGAHAESGDRSTYRGSGGGAAPAGGEAEAAAAASAGGVSPGGGADDMGGGGGGDDDDDLAAAAGEEVALAAAERALANRTPKRPTKLTQPLPSDAGAPLTAPAGSDVSGGGGGGGGGGPDGGGGGVDALPAVAGSPTGGLVSAGDPLVSPSRFSSAAKGRRGRGLRRSYPDSPTPAAPPAGPPANLAGGGGGGGRPAATISQTLAALPDLFASKAAVQDHPAEGDERPQLDQTGPDGGGGGGERGAPAPAGTEAAAAAEGSQRQRLSVPVPVPVPERAGSNGV
ncbi:hypothetical protein HYH03_012451 [Edaphochlamys debaryana]|uniref:K Homology domain-containing protein n=1 Tax=Edaphochlamys debaryana TaxID=47281 RepID=A0A836BUE7_9CHLO|nr:hypothetical protein HYH03_012451 [Edaphochlamys debaryana]|eukprot:KAG2489012.1 hypothetical protein HYH03_012451 [Edaphochlamys debaryana]